MRSRGTTSNAAKQAIKAIRARHRTPIKRPKNLYEIDFDNGSDTLQVVFVWADSLEEAASAFNEIGCDVTTDDFSGIDADGYYFNLWRKYCPTYIVENGHFKDEDE